MDVLYKYRRLNIFKDKLIVFMFEKIALDMNIVPSNKNFDWIQANNITVPNNNNNDFQMSNESLIIHDLDLIEYREESIYKGEVYSFDNIQ